MRWMKVNNAFPYKPSYCLAFSNKERRLWNHGWINAAIINFNDGLWDLEIWNTSLLTSSLVGVAGNWGKPISFTNLKTAKQMGKFICANTKF